MYEKYEELLKKTGKTSYQVSKDTGIGQNTLSNSIMVPIAGVILEDRKKQAKDRED